MSHALVKPPELARSLGLTAVPIWHEPCQRSAWMLQVEPKLVTDKGLDYLDYLPKPARAEMAGSDETNWATVSPSMTALAGNPFWD